MTYQQILKYAPDLPSIRQQAVKLLADNENPKFWDNYEHIKSLLNQRVGQYAPQSLPEFMHTSEAHDIAFAEVFEGLV